MARCPYCGFEGGLELVKVWKFRFYEVKKPLCPRCGRRFNHYYGVSKAPVGR